MSTLKETIEDVMNEMNLPITIHWDSLFKKKRNSYANVTCNLCGHQSIRQIDNFRKGKFNCNNCIHDNYRKRADDLGFEFIGLNRQGKKSLAILKCKVDNSIKEVQTGTLMRNNIQCEDCLVRYYQSKLSEKYCIYVSRDIKGITFRNRFGEIKRIQAGAIGTGEWFYSKNRIDINKDDICY